MLDFTSPMHLILIILVIVLLFGGKKIPELMKGIGQGMKEFKKASSLNDETEKKETEVKDLDIKALEKKQ
jgi:sec-independent protein translocase protein TatA